MAEGTPGWHGTTIVAVRRGGRVVVAGDGQVSVGQTVMKGTARMTSMATKPLKPRPVLTWPSHEAWISLASVDWPALKSCPNATRPMMSRLVLGAQFHFICGSILYFRKTVGGVWSVRDDRVRRR